MDFGLSRANQSFIVAVTYPKGQKKTDWDPPNHFGNPLRPSCSGSLLSSRGYGPTKAVTEESGSLWPLTYVVSCGAFGRPPVGRTGDYPGRTGEGPRCDASWIKLVTCGAEEPCPTQMLMWRCWVFRLNLLKMADMSWSNRSYRHLFKKKKNMHASLEALALGDLRSTATKPEDAVVEEPKLSLNHLNLCHHHGSIQWLFFQHTFLSRALE